VKRRFDQLDVFSAVPLRGNPLAVVHDAEGLDEARMAAFARWTQLSETTFLLPPRDPAADYRVRIFTPLGELPFAGHPTLGSCHAWLAAGGRARATDEVVQECGVGLVRVRRPPQGRLAFAAPPLRRSGPLDEALRARIASALALAPGDIVDHQWVDNGPGWCAVRLPSADAVAQVRVDGSRLGEIKLGLVGFHPAGSEALYEVRALFSGIEDPVTGSLNASLAQWLIGSGAAPRRYLATQGRTLERDGRVHIEQLGDTVWVGGDVASCIVGEVQL
jgi:PhzF family phenazine biosynthesis protein